MEDVNGRKLQDCGMLSDTVFSQKCLRACNSGRRSGSFKEWWVEDIVILFVALCGFISKALCSPDKLIDCCSYRTVIFPSQLKAVFNVAFYSLTTVSLPQEQLIKYAFISLAITPYNICDDTDIYLKICQFWSILHKNRRKKNSP